jgi:uncharacterized protein YdeI (YjbR/CyaY-like superfamily)
LETEKDGIQAYYATGREDWRNWLLENHAKSVSVWLILFKKEKGIPSLNYDEAVEEALCFGWIDSKPNKRDDKSFYLFFAKRKPKSNWSALNSRPLKSQNAFSKV